MFKVAYKAFTAALLAALCLQGVAQVHPSKVWVADNGDGTYKNPVLFADFPDPDVIRVKDSFYMVVSTFNTVPGLTLLKSSDLVTWDIVGHALKQLYPANHFSQMQHGNGVWAPSLRYHKGFFYIYWGDPDFGIYMVKSKVFEGDWSRPILVKEGKGLIDPCPLWDDNGKAYLVHGWAGSRAGIKSILTVSEMAPDGCSLVGDETIVFDGHDAHPTVEGPKFYKRDGYYYIFAPAGGVATGWQLALRAKSPFGPYEHKVVLEQGKSAVNGPHQGGWVDDIEGNHWFIHFQDRSEFGRIVHLQPMKWVDGWPFMGIDSDGNGIGEPVDTYTKPASRRPSVVMTPGTSDEFNERKIGMQWQWHANPQPTWAFINADAGALRMYCMPVPESFVSFWDVPNLLMQRISGPEMMATTRLKFKSIWNDEKAGLMVMGDDYGYLSVDSKDGKLYLNQVVCSNASKGGTDVIAETVSLDVTEVYLRTVIRKDGQCSFWYSLDGVTFKPVGASFKAKEGRWIGARVGLFAIGMGKEKRNDAGFADFDWFRVDKPE